MDSMKYSRFASRARRSVAYWTRVAMRDFTSELLARIGSTPRAKFAEVAGVSPAYVTKVLSGSENFTIETMTKLALAVGGKVRVHIADIDADTRWLDSQTSTSATVVMVATSHAPPMQIVPIGASGREMTVEA